MLTNPRIAITLVSVLPLVVAATGIFDDCPLCQNGTMGHAATIQCSIGSNFSGVYWYIRQRAYPWYTSNYILLAFYEPENKNKQSENDDPEYVIEFDGSLRINNVSAHHSRVYRVGFFYDEYRIQKKRVRFLVNRECSMSEDLEREYLYRKIHPKKKTIVKKRRMGSRFKAERNSEAEAERLERRRERSRAKKQKRLRI